MQQRAKFQGKFLDSSADLGVDRLALLDSSLAMVLPKEFVSSHHKVTSSILLPVQRSECASLCLSVPQLASTSSDIGADGGSRLVESGSAMRLA
jgi:hypothetical protein